MVETTLQAALAAAFVISAIDYFRYLPFWRGLIALLVAVAALVALGESGWTLPVLGAAAAFLAMSFIGVVDWLITPKVVRASR